MQRTSILERYKSFNNHEGNSLSAEFSPEIYSVAACNYPDNEDLNNDNILNCENTYREFNISLRPDDFAVGQNYIDDMLSSEVQLVNGLNAQINWYHFKIPIENNSLEVGNVGSLDQIRSIRLYLTNFENPIVLRLVDFKLKNN